MDATSPLHLQANEFLFWGIARNRLGRIRGNCIWNANRGQYHSRCQHKLHLRVHRATLNPYSSFSGRPDNGVPHPSGVLKGSAHYFESAYYRCT